MFSKLRHTSSLGFMGPGQFLAFLTVLFVLVWSAPSIAQEMPIEEPENRFTFPNWLG